MHLLFIFCIYAIKYVVQFFFCNITLQRFCNITQISIDQLVTRYGEVIKLKRKQTNILFQTPNKLQKNGRNH
jgi:hypothetical protein